MMKKIQLLASLAGALLSVTLSLTACADSVEANIKKTLQKHLGAGTPIETISKTPYSGLYEVKIGVRSCTPTQRVNIFLLVASSKPNLPKI
jgi:thiol:disulfide interchange protein DsbC